MQSNTKIKLSQPEIGRLLGRVYDDIPSFSARELTDGWYNTAYHITMDGGHGQTVLKVGPPAEADILTYEKDLLRAEVTAMKLVATNAEIPVPRIIYADFSHERLPYDYYFMDFISGKTWDKIRDSLTAEQNGIIEYRLGRITAQINAFEHKAFGYLASGPGFDNWLDAFQWMCALLFADAQRYRVALEISEQEFFDRFNEHRAIFAEITRPQLVHWDLWAGNIFITVDGEIPQIAGIIDFERALWGDPLMESYPGRLVGLESYITGYGEEILATRGQRLRRIFYNIYLDLVMVIEDGPRQYDDKGSVAWAQERLRRDIAMLRQGDSL